MDPDETLRLIRAALANVVDAPTDYLWTQAVAELVEHLTALDGWLSTGGFLPVAWRRQG